MNEREKQLTAMVTYLRMVISSMRNEAINGVSAVMDMKIRGGDKDEIIAALQAIEEYADNALALPTGSAEQSADLSASSSAEPPATVDPES